MKKTLIITTVTISMLTSCGPHRMQCGPGGGRRCVDNGKTETLKNEFESIKKSRQV